VIVNRKFVRTLAVAGVLAGGLFAAPVAANAAVQSCQGIITGQLTGKALCLVTGHTQYRVALTCTKLDGGGSTVEHGVWKNEGGGWSTAGCPGQTEATKAGWNTRT
jgi:hypothetical protein